MAQIEDCPSFETFGEDVKAAREALNMLRRVLAERVDTDPRYLANIELEQTIKPSFFIKLINAKPILAEERSPP